MENSKKYWYKLLKHFDNKNYFQNGLTLPFIIGSRKYIDPATKLQNIREIIVDFNTSGFFINVLKCDTIGEYVFRISDCGDEKIYRTLDNFVITDSSFMVHLNTEGIIKLLEKEYNKYIKDGKFSKTNGIWGPYSIDLDIPRIKEIK